MYHVWPLKPPQTPPPLTSAKSPSFPFFLFEALPFRKWSRRQSKSLIEVFQCFAPVHCYSNKPNISNSIDGSLHYGHQLLWHIDYSLGGLKKIESRIWNYLCVDSHIDRYHVKFEGPRWLGSASSGPPSPHIGLWSDTSPRKGVSFFLCPANHIWWCQLISGQILTHL